jgi:hypothetical protein
MRITTSATSDETHGLRKTTRSYRLVAAALVLATNAAAAAPEIQAATEPNPAVSAECPSRADLGLCQAKSWPATRAGMQRLIDLVFSREFAALETAMSAAAKSNSPSGPGGDDAIAAYEALEMLSRIPSSSEYASLPEAWASAVPGSPFVKIIQAMRLQMKALEIADQMNIGGMARQNRQLFESRISDALKTLEAVKGPGRDTLAWHALHVQLLAYGRGTGVSAPLRNASKRWPGQIILYAAAAESKAWIKDWKAIEAIVALAVERTSSGDGMSFYARLYTLLGGLNVHAPTGLDWSRMKAGFEDWTSRDPSWEVRSLYAAYACVARDISAYRTATAAAGPQDLREEAWLPGHSREACTRWASVAT